MSKEGKAASVTGRDEVGEETESSSKPAMNASMDPRTLAMIMYGLFLCGYFTGGLTALMGVVVAYVKKSEADELTGSHFVFAIRTFWVSVVVVCIGTLLSLIGIGVLILLAWVIWSAVRLVRGLILLNDFKPINNPRSFGIGG